jgi:hypothetical protein
MAIVLLGQIARLGRRSAYYAGKERKYRIVCAMVQFAWPELNLNRSN